MQRLWVALRDLFAEMDRDELIVWSLVAAIVILAVVSVLAYLVTEGLR